MIYLLDTNVVSESIRSKPDKNVSQFLQKIPADSLYISAFTIGEIRKGIERVSNDDYRQQKLKYWLENDLLEFFSGRIIAFDHSLADKWGFMVGKIKNPVPVVDSMIAAICLALNFTLVTRNTKDFENFNIEILNPWLN